MSVLFVYKWNHASALNLNFKWGRVFLFTCDFKTFEVKFGHTYEESMAEVHLNLVVEE